MKEITAYAIVVRKIESKGKKDFLGNKHILYFGENLYRGDCSCAYVEEVYNIFKTKKEAEVASQYVPYPYRQAEVEVRKVKIICK